jgi:TolB-like protein/DNA-binding winged helix-turn-helix (wHTH) protein
MRLLLCLAERPGEIVKTDALLKAVWSEVVVTPDSVYQAVASLRRSLGDDPKKPEYIATIARVGYRLIAPVGPADAAEIPASEREPARPTASRIRGRSRRLVFAAIALAAVIVAAVAAIMGHQRALSPAAQTIAVLPFLDLTSQSMDQEYFADGMTEELIDRLSRIQGVSVSSPSASFYYKNKNLPPFEIGTALGVRYLLDGSVRQSGATLRVTARLLRASDGFVIWTETFERDSQDPLKVQDSIAQAVSERMRSSLDDGA